VVETANIVAFPLPQDCKLLAEVVDATEHHLVAALDRARIRLCLRKAVLHRPECFIIPRDRCTAVRLVAASRFERVTHGGRLGNSGTTGPSTYQRARIVRLLAIQDGLDAGASARDIAFGLVFSRQRPLVGATWKGSSERRHTLRLIAETRRIVDRGYHRLLHHI
jgi:hypothetical protein